MIQQNNKRKRKEKREEVEVETPFQSFYSKNLFQKVFFVSDHLTDRKEGATRSVTSARLLTGQDKPSTSDEGVEQLPVTS